MAYFQSVAVHCYNGFGRTGTMIACYLIQDEGLTACQALGHVREMRPGSVETSDQENFICDFEETIRQMPDSFSWVVDDLLCTMAFPKSRQNLQYLVDNNVAYLVSFTAEIDPPIQLCQDLELVSLKVQDSTTPSVHQVEEFLSVMDKAGKKKKAVALHCSQGGRHTGPLITCYLIKVQGLREEDAIEKTQQLKHGAIEAIGTKEEEELVHDFVKCLHKGLLESDD